MERNRLRISKGYIYLIEGVLYQEFTREKDYLDVCEYAANFGYVLWKLDKQRLVVLSLEGHDCIRAWLKERASNHNA
jgi:hypothetical protein